MTKREIALKIRGKNPGLSLQEIEHHMELFLGELKRNLAKGEEVAIRGLGTFKIKRQAGRPVRDFKSGDMAPLPPMYTVHLKPCRQLNSRLNKAKAKQINKD